MTAKIEFRATTLGELRRAAQELLDAGVPPETRVESEGCDCWGPASNLSWNGEIVLLERKP